MYNAFIITKSTWFRNAQFCVRLSQVPSILLCALYACRDPNFFKQAAFSNYLEVFPSAANSVIYSSIDCLHKKLWQILVPTWNSLHHENGRHIFSRVYNNKNQYPSGFYAL